jgi:hypothetical protein
VIAAEEKAVAEKIARLRALREAQAKEDGR